MQEQPGQDDIRAQRLTNLQKLVERGYHPFGSAFERSGRLSEVRARFQENARERVAGRIVARREMGKSIFAHLDDSSDRFQVYVKKDVVGEPAFDAFRLLDLGDHIGVEGELFTTKTGELSLKVQHWTLLSKALLPLPEKWHGLHDVEIRYRQRYLDLIANPGVREVFQKRGQIIREIRGYLHNKGFVEVETPMIQPLAGGAAANPFRTHYASLGADMFLRIAPELYLKRLLVGGFDKVFELNRNFRNEGLSRSHNPEFTMLEIYEAYGDVRTMMRLVEEMVTTVAQSVVGTLILSHGEKTIDLNPPWRSVTYRELVAASAGPDYFGLSLTDKQARAHSLGVHVEPTWPEFLLTQEIFEKRIEKTLNNPTFVTRMPVELVPLAKACEDDPTVVDVFELVMDGREVAPAYSELNDPVEQRKRLEAQVHGDASKIDEEFLTALEHGMPPAGGMGVGIDRLVMTLTGAESIREVILFPQLKPKT